MVDLAFPLLLADRSSLENRLAALLTLAQIAQTLVGAASPSCVVRPTGHLLRVAVEEHGRAAVRATDRRPPPPGSPASCTLMHWVLLVVVGTRFEDEPAFFLAVGGIESSDQGESSRRAGAWASRATATFWTREMAVLPLQLDEGRCRCPGEFLAEQASQGWRHHRAVGRLAVSTLKRKNRRLTLTFSGTRPGRRHVAARSSLPPCIMTQVPSIQG